MGWLGFRRIIKLGLTNFWRNRWLSLASTLVMTLTLLIISLFMIMTIVINKTTDRIKAKMDITVYFLDSATTDQISDLQQQLVSRPDVSEVKYISKDDALKIWQENQKNLHLKDMVSSTDNPLPRSIAVKASNPEDLNSIAEYVASNTFKPIIHKISYEENKAIIDKLLAITSFIKKMGWIASVIFVLISILVILNTIRLAIFARKDEVEIMRLVGASDRFIKLPFVVEGTLYGFIACILAMFLIWLGIFIISPLTNRYLGTDVTANIRTFFIAHFALIFFIQLVIGIAVGIGCSLFSIRKYLRV